MPGSSEWHLPLQVDEQLVVQTVEEILQCLAHQNGPAQCQLASRLITPVGMPSNYVGVLHTLTKDSQARYPTFPPQKQTRPSSNAECSERGRRSEVDFRVQTRLYQLFCFYVSVSDSPSFLPERFNDSLGWKAVESRHTIASLMSGCNSSVQDPNVYVKNDVARLVWNFLALRLSRGRAKLDSGAAL